MAWDTAHVDVGARTYRVLAFHPSQGVYGVKDEGNRRRLEARAGEGLLVLEDEEGGRWHLPVGLGGCLDPHRLQEKG